MAIDLTGKVCAITGAGTGIGLALAAGFALRGATVYPTDIEAPLIPGCAKGIAWDVRDPYRADAVVAEIIDLSGRVDAFVANAGIMPRQAWDDISPAEWREVHEVNLDGAWYGCQAAARAMSGTQYGKIVLVSSIEVELGVALHCHYDASKAALIGMMRALARAVGPSGIRVNCLMPGAVQTESEKLQFPDQRTIAHYLADRQCLPGRISPRMIEPVAAFLCSPESDAITGQVLCVDHGWVMY